MNATPPIEDDELAAQAAGGARDSFEALVSRYGARVLGVATRHTGDHHQALDLAQEIWLKVYRSFDRFRPGAAFRPWLFGIALNHLRDAHRRKKSARVVYMEDYRQAPAAAAAFDPRGERDERDAIGSALDRVSEPYRTALGLVDVDGLSYEEAALVLDCAIGTVKSRVNRGRLLFRDHYVRMTGETARGGAAAEPGGHR